MKKEHLDELRAIVGEKNVATDRQALKRFFDEVPEKPDLVVASPTDQHRLSHAAGFAYDNDIPMYTHRHRPLAAEVAGSDGILFDLSGIDGITRIDEPNLLAFIDYGVTFERMKKELDEKNLRLLMPVAAKSSSVVRSYVDRDVIMANGSTRPYQLTIFHAILADGRVWMSGNDQMTPDGHSEFREDIGPMYSYFFHASEDIFGMPYAAKVFLYKRWEERRVTAYGFDKAEDAIKAAYRASRGDQVFECVVADAPYLSVLLTDDPDDADELRGELPPWSVVFGFDNHPSLVDVWDRQTGNIATENGGTAAGNLAEMMPEKFELPWYVRDRDHYRGHTELIDYYTFPGKAASLFEKTDSILGEYETGRVAVPAYFGGAFYCETDIYCERGDPETEKAWLDSYRELLEMGAHVTRPTGEVARIIYQEKLDPENVRMIKNLKRVLDPKGLLNKDQLLEGV